METNKKMYEFVKKHIPEGQEVQLHKVIGENIYYLPPVDNDIPDWLDKLLTSWDFLESLNVRLFIYQGGERPMMRVNEDGALIEGDTPRKAIYSLNTDAEKAIFHAMEKVEELGADAKLTQAVTLLMQAKYVLAEYIDEKEGLKKP